MIVGLIPAAGRGERMGRPKLTLPVGGVPLIARVIEALRGGGADAVFVVIPPLDRPGAGELRGVVEGAGAEAVIAPSPPIHMRASVEMGMAGMSPGLRPDAVLLTPGDLPGLRAGEVARLIAASAGAPGRIVVPVHEGRRGHPALIPWPLACRIRDLPPGVGVNALLAAFAAEVLEIEAPDPAFLADLDTPEDYRAWSGA